MELLLLPQSYTLAGCTLGCSHHRQADTSLLSPVYHHLSWAAHQVCHSASDQRSRPDAQDSERILALPKEGSCVLEIITSSAMLSWGIIYAT